MPCSRAIISHLSELLQEKRDKAHPQANEDRATLRADKGGARRGEGAGGVKLGGRVENLKNAELGRERGAAVRREKAAARTADLLPVINTIRAEGVTSATGIATTLNERGIPTTRGGRWQAVQVQRILRSTGRVN
jgi:Recombinase